MSAPYFTSATLGLFLKGKDAAAEVEQAAQGWQFDCELKPSMTDADARIVLLNALKPKREG
jgi:16S rRNA (guanine527-N7)-methyltransferase